MKLELEFPTASSSVSPNFAAIAANYSEIPELLQAGINFAKEGKREEARLFLWRVASIEPENEIAWLWLASISEYPEELLVFLQNVLNVNPNNERALEWQKGTKVMLANTFVERGISASQGSQKELANQCFMQALLHDNQNEMAWLWLASIADSQEEKIAHLQKVLDINPENVTALDSIKSLKNEISQSLLKKANFAAISGERQTSRELLDEVMQNAPELEDAWMLKAYLADDFEEKVACYEKILNLNPENEAAQAGLASLQALIQRSVEQKSNVEAIQQVFASSGASVLDTEKTVEFSMETEEVSIEAEEVSAPTNEFSTQTNEFSADEEAAHLEILEVEELEILDEPLFEDEVQVEEEEFVLDSQDDENEAPKHFENPTDELDANFVEEVKAQGGFAHLPEAESAKEESVLEEAEPTFYSFDEDTAESIEIPEPEVAEQNVSDFAHEDSNVFGGVNLEMPVEVQSQSTEETFLPQVETHSYEESALPDVKAHSYEESFLPEVESHSFGESSLPKVESHSYEESSLPEVESHSYETTVLDSEYLDKVSTESEHFAYSPQASVIKEATMMQEEVSQNVEDSYVATSPVEVKAEESEMEQVSHRASMPSERLFCPFCYATNEPQAFVCCSCNLMLSLSDMEMILAHTGAKPDVFEMAIEDLEAERGTRQMSEEELTNLGIAYLNAKNFRNALSCLQEASQMNPNNIVLGSKVNFLAIRLSEIEAQESKAEGVVAKNLTIMVVDDSPTVRKLISGKLEKSGHVVLTAADGHEALEKIEEIIPDLVLLDIMMPHMDGYQVCKLIRSNEATKDVPVVMISGKDGFFDKVRGRMAGTTGYITKPFGPETLMKTIEAYVS